MGEAAADNYQVNIPLFEGPLDLLLHLVTKNRIDIHDIPIHLITDQYLAYLESARQFNLDLGSSFFAMASTLILIKSRMLLPEKRREEMDESEDPRQELSRSLEEFKRMKEVKARIEALMEEESPYRGREPEIFRTSVFQGKISLSRLQAAFLSLYDSLEEEEERILPSEEVSLDREIEGWERTLEMKPWVMMTGYLKKMKTRLRLAVAFLALLELIRLGKARVEEAAEGLVIKGGSL
ncbi:segregation and condensation protein A [Dialister succinatiphilus]|jgi:segregation and condensation protein A|uniref:segregation and condensation protein A n=1 Tax=Dialister succinatiphilus TaxID=487173 RepID=UPI002355A26E|nr:segregation/condensation protein A [Dialister succinatiphilus]